MSSDPSGTTRTTLTASEVRHDLQATLGARDELGPEMEDHVIDAFLARIEQRIETRVEQAVAEVRKSNRPNSAPAGGANFAAVVAPSLALSIPLIAIAAAGAGSLGVMAVMGTVFAINLLYFVYELMAVRR
jgi:hypothetical protein